jgi:L-lactate utilization protein LutC
MTPQRPAAREEILNRVRASLGRQAGADGEISPDELVPASARIASRPAGKQEAEMDQLLAEITELGGHVRRLASASDLASALAELVEAEQVERATLWHTPEMRSLGLDQTLASLGVEVTPDDASPLAVAGCDLGITGVDAALPETGTLVLRSGPERPNAASLLPRVHLALLTPGALRADLQAALEECRGASCVTLISGPSRTSDIELTLTIGVHGPKALYVWVLWRDS